MLALLSVVVYCRFCKSRSKENLYMHRSRILSTSIAALAAVGLLSGCGGSSAPASGEESAPASGANAEPSTNATGEVTFWTALGGMGDVAEKFNSTHEGITVKFEEIPNGANGGYAKIAAAIQAGNGPDVAGFEYPVLPQFVANGSLLPIDDLISEQTRGKYSEQLRGLSTFGDQMYAMPYDQAPLVVYYRQDLLEAAGVSEPPKTWEEFRTAAEKVKETNPDQRIVSFNPNEPAVLAALAWQAGGQWFGIDADSWVVGIDDEASQKVAEFWQGLIDDDLVKVTASFSDEWTADMADGKTIGVLGASWSAAGIMSRTEGNDQAGKWIAATPPSWGDQASAFYGGTTYAITKDAKNPEAAAVFLEWLTTDPESIKARGDVGSTYPAFPGLSVVPQETFNVGYFANDIYSIYDESAAAVVDGWNWGPAWDSTNTPLLDALGKVENGETIIDALKTAQSATVEALSASGLSVK